MAEFGVVAQARNGYEVGDPVYVIDDGLDHGNRIELPDWWIIKVPSLTLADVKTLELLGGFWQAAGVGDPELFNEDDADKRVHRHRVKNRVLFGSLPVARQNELDTRGWTILSYDEFKVAYIALAYDKVAEEVTETGGTVLP